MIQRQSGFSVIEFVISIMISAMLMTGALTIYQQISKGMISIQTLTQEDIACTIIKNRLSLDLIGLCPLWFTADQLQPSANNTEQIPKQSGQQKTSSTTPQNQNILKSNYLYAQNKDDQFSYLTFVTTSTLQTYTQPQSQCSRVVYALKPNSPIQPNNNSQNQQQLFTLQRKEESIISNEFDRETITQGEFYTIAKSISKCIIEYGFIDTPREKRYQQPELEWKIKWVNHWDSSDDKKKSSDFIPSLPDLVRVKIIIKENPEKDGKEYEFYCLLPHGTDTNFQSFAQKRYDKQHNTKQSPTQPDQPKSSNSNNRPPNAVTLNQQ